MVTTTNNLSSNSTENPEAVNQPRRLLLVSCPRTASNLLLKILNLPNQPNITANEKGGYFFFDAYMAAAKDGYIEKRPNEWTKEEYAKFQDIFQQCFDNLEEASSKANSEGKVLLAKEHAFWFVNPSAGFADKDVATATTGSGMAPFLDIPSTAYGPSQTFSATNKTVFSDEYLRSWQLAFIIRHPALMFPSMYRAMMKMSKIGYLDPDALQGAMDTNMSMYWTRMMCDWCVEQGTTPVIIDANDLIHNPGAVVKFCELTGLDPTAVKFEWETGKPEMNDGEVIGSQAASRIMLGTLQDSSGIVKSKAPSTIDIAVEAKKWKEEFGEEKGEMVEKAVLAAMPDYEYLKDRRIKA